MTKQDLQRAFDDLRDNNDSGARAYRVAEFLAPMVKAGVPTNDVDLALFEGAECMNTATTPSTKYQASEVTDTTTTWTAVAVV